MAAAGPTPGSLGGPDTIETKEDAREGGRIRPTPESVRLFADRRRQTTTHMPGGRRPRGFGNAGEVRQSPRGRPPGAPANPNRPMPNRHGSQATHRAHRPVGAGQGERNPARRRRLRGWVNGCYSVRTGDRAGRESPAVSARLRWWKHARILVRRARVTALPTPQVGRNPRGAVHRMHRETPIFDERDLAGLAGPAGRAGGGCREGGRRDGCRRQGALGPGGALYHCAASFR